MSALDEVVDYIIDRKTHPGRPSDGIKFIKDNFRDEDIYRLVDISFQIIQMYFTKSTVETPAGEARLTTVSSGIGNRIFIAGDDEGIHTCLLYTSPSPRDRTRSRMPSSA